MIKAKSAMLADVSSAVLSAKDGDTVSVPAGTATWTDTLTVSSNITLSGAGAGSTIIIDGLPGAPSNASHDNEITSEVPEPQRPVQRRGRDTVEEAGRKPRKLPSSQGGRKQISLVLITLDRDRPFRMSGFTFRGISGSRGNNANGKIRVMGSCHAFRVDHCVFDKLSGTNVGVSGFLWGVIDHCQFHLTKQQPIRVSHEAWNGKDNGNGSWADDPHWGTEKFVFIEDNVFENASGTNTAVDAYEGARFVVRHNQFHNCGLAMHGTEGRGRGGKEVEEYNNTYKYDKGAQAGQIRSGCIISHDNTWTNVTKGHVLRAYRAFSFSPHWGYCTGENPYDDNAPKEGSGYWETGKHMGADGATTLSDPTKNWETNQWYQPGAIYIVRNKTKEAAARREADKVQSFAVSNTANTITCSLLSHFGTPLTFNHGDIYQVWKVMRSLDQPGVGKGDLLTGFPGRPAKWPQQATEPCYSWNNNQDGEAVSLSTTEPSIKEGRDFFNDKAKPNYQPYTYPHHLVNAATP